jgi:polyhydroxyalkanoate synthesis regulator phasin
MAMLTEEKQKPSLWNQALKVVKGDSTAELVEQFTQEMTLVAEGLCEDQARLRKAVDGLMKEGEGQRAKSEQDYQDVLRQLENHQKDVKQKLDELARRVSVLEKPAAKEKKGKLRLGGDIIGRLTILASIVCGSWIIVTLLKLFM